MTNNFWAWYSYCCCCRWQFLRWRWIRWQWLLSSRYCSPMVSFFLSFTSTLDRLRVSKRDSSFVRFYSIFIPKGVNTTFTEIVILHGCVQEYFEIYGIKKRIRQTRREVNSWWVSTITIIIGNNNITSIIILSFRDDMMMSSVMSFERCGTSVE